MTLAELAKARVASVVTPAEYDVLVLRTKGLSQRQIALALDISRSTVRDRMANGDRKIELHRRKAAA